MLEFECVNLAKHRLSTANEDYNAATNLFEGGHFKAANNRAYYSVFHSIRAILALEGKDFKNTPRLLATLTNIMCAQKYLIRNTRKF